MGVSTSKSLVAGLAALIFSAIVGLTATPAAAQWHGGGGWRGGGFGGGWHGGGWRGGGFGGGWRGAGWGGGGWGWGGGCGGWGCGGWGGPGWGYAGWGIPAVGLGLGSRLGMGLWLGMGAQRRLRRRQRVLGVSQGLDARRAVPRPSYRQYLHVGRERAGSGALRRRSGGLGFAHGGWRMSSARIRLSRMGESLT